MKLVFFDLSMGAAGDMITAALLELMPDREKTVEALNAMGIPEIHFQAEKTEKNGICGTHMTVLARGIDEAEFQAQEFEHRHGYGHEHSHEEHDDDKRISRGTEADKKAA